MTQSATTAPRFATPRVAAGALFVDEQGRALMLRLTYKKSWDIPGGYVEPGESPLQACTREIREELGLDVAVGRLLVVDWAPHPDEGDKMLFIFDGGRLTAEQLAAVRFVDGEIAEWAYADDARIDDVAVPRLARRIKAALDAREQLQTLYLQDGKPV